VLIDPYLPEFDVAERHAVTVNAPAERTWEAVRRLDLSRSRSIRLLLAARGLTRPRRRSRPGRRATMTFDDLTRQGFVLLEQADGVEKVFGIVGRFWKPSSGVLRLDGDGFASFDQPGYAKAVWNFRVEPRGDQRSVVWTETRVRCTDEASRRKFVLYWAAIGPFSGIIRKRALALAKRDAEGPG
jgi:hypothetical protein